MDPVWINRGEPGYALDIAAAERRLDGVYVGDFAVRTGGPDGRWSDRPVMVFFVEQPKQRHHAQYVGLFPEYPTGSPTQHLMVCDASSAADQSFGAVVSRGGEVLYSRYRQDFRTSADGSVFVDGGRDYVRYGGPGVDAGVGTVRLRIVREHIVVNDCLYLPYQPPSAR